jgi:O-antigen ligase
LVSLVIASSFVYRDIAKLLARNAVIIAYISFIVISAAWSIHPDITLRRGLGCILTILVAAYLAVRFDEKDKMKLFSFFFAIPAIVSLVAAMAGYSYADGIGIYAKNALGRMMAVAIFVELYLLALGNWRPIWRFGLLSIYLTLLILSHSVTGWLCAMLFLAGTAIYIIAKRDKLAGIIAVITFAWLLLLLQLGLWYNAGSLLAVFGKDSTLTGRTDIWVTTLDLIKQKPLLGWGYMATWVPTDPQIGAIREDLRWAVPNAHSAYLDVALQLGLVGLGLLLTIIAVASYRAQACCKRGILPLGWFSLVFIAGALLYGVSETGLGQNQSIFWLLLNVFNFSCGSKLASLGRRGQYRDRLRPEFAAAACDRKPAAFCNPRE